MEEKILKFECALDRIIYPKYSKKVQSGDFAIFSMRITKWIDNKIDEIETIKLKGTTCTLEYGTTYKVFCKLAETHEIYGDTYGLIYISKCIDISSKDKQKEFLKNVLNENLVEKLFDEYDDVIKLLENRDVKSLMKIKGIGNQVALRMIDEYEESKDYSSIYMELGQLGFTHTFIKKLVDFYKSPDTVIDIVKNNPYDLLRVEGIGFKKADEVACKVGITQYDIRRIKGFLLYYLNDQGEAGRSYLNYQDLMKALYDTLGFVPEEIINATAKQMIDNKDVVVLDNGSKIALKKFYDLEKNIMNELFRLQIGLVKVVENDSNKVNGIHDDYIPKSFNIGNWETITENVEEKQGFMFTDEQRAAIKLSLDNHVMALTGGAGVGKTSTANGICSLYSGYSILACALSGKASVRITEATGLPASTIHRALGYQNGEFMFNKENKLAVDIVLIDEATMINGTLFLSLLEAIPTGAKVIIMGDVQQLTPIGNCQVFADILDSNVLPVVKLSKPHRQALRSGIIPTSIKIANQQQIFDGNYTGNAIIGELEDMELDISGKGNDESISDKIIKHFQVELEKFHDIMEVQICVPMRLRGELSCYNLNSKIQSIYNPKLNDGNEIEVFLEKKKDETKKYTIRVGDKVINTKNNYKCLNSEGDQTPVFNGNMGIVKEIEKNGMCTIDFIGVGEVLFTKSDCKNLELGYACTVHKCITDDTWLFTSNGLMQLKEFNNNASIGEQKILTNNVDVFNGKELEKPIKFYNAGESECKEIITENGYKITATLDHGVDVLDTNGYIKKKYVKDITSDDYLIIVPGSNAYGNDVNLPKVWKVDTSKLDIRSKIFNTPNILTLEFARFLGYMVADGVVCKSGIKYGKNHKNVVDDFNRLIFEIFGYPTKSPKQILPNGSMGGMWLSEINSKFISEYCKTIDGIQPHNKYVPDIILKAPKEFQIEFLKGVFEDGSVCVKKDKFDHISFTAKEELLVDQINMMLLNIGIITSKYHRKKPESYTLFVYGANCDKFIKNIGFISDVKREKSMKYYNHSLEVSYKAIPYVKKIILQIIDESNIDTKTLSKELNIHLERKNITYNMIKKFVEYCNKYNIDNSKLEYLSYVSRLSVQKIKSITRKVEHTYCLEMPKTHKFVQNGIQGYNCQGSGFCSTIVGLDNSSYIMNNSELLYTAITRAKKYCVLIANNYAVMKSIQTKEVKTKQTFLKDMLLENAKRLKEKEN